MNKPYSLYAGKDLTETLITLSNQELDRNAHEYADKWEWNPVTVEEIKKYNIEPTLKYSQYKSTCLIAGCQSGRDYSLLAQAGIRCVGVGNSYGLLSEAVKRVPGGIFIHSDLRELSFLPKSFDIVYADALVSVPKKDIKNILKDFKIFLKDTGIIYLSFHKGISGIYSLNDLEGSRYLTVFSKREILELINSVGLDLLWSKESVHTDPSLPGWFSLVARKT
jgi:SAM-dependent methyltransferase